MGLQLAAESYLIFGNMKILKPPFFPVLMQFFVFCDFLERHFILVNGHFINTTCLSMRFRKIITKTKKNASKMKK